jgi:hypothetical protein
MSLSVIMYDPPSQQQQNVRTVYKVQKGVSVVPSTIKLTNLKINPNVSKCYFPAMGGAYLSLKQVELLIGDKPVDLFLSKQCINFKNSLGTPDYQYNILTNLAGTSNNVYQDVELGKLTFSYITVDDIPQCIEFKHMLDYLNNRMVIDEGLTIILTWDSSNLDWLLTGGDPDAEKPTSVNIDPGYLSYEVLTDHNLPKQDIVNFKQTIEEVVLLPAVGDDDNQTQLWEQRMNSLREKFVNRVLFVNEPLGQLPDIANNQLTFGRYASYGMNNEYINIVIDGNQRLTFKGFSNNAHKLAMTADTFGEGSSTMTSFFLPKDPVAVDITGENTVQNYYSYLGVELNSFVEKECVIQYNRTSTVVDEYPSLDAPMKLYMISEVLKQHNTQTGVCSYVRV